MAKGYLEEQIRYLKGVFKDRKTLLVTYGFDLLFYFFLIIGFVVWGLFVKNKSNELAGVDFGGIMAGDLVKMNLSYDVMVSFLVFLLISIFIYLIFVALIFSLFKGMIWLRLMKKKANWKYFSKFFLFNIIYLGIFFGIFVYFVLNSQVALGYVVSLIGIHFLIVFSYFFTKEQKIGRGLGKTLVSGFRLDKFLFSYVLIGVAYYLFDRLFYLIRSNMAKGWGSLLTLAIFLLFAAMVRIYLKNLIEGEFDGKK